MKEDRILDWLLEDSEPSIRYLTLTQLLDRPGSDPEVRTAHDRIGKLGWAAEILAQQHRSGFWVSGTRLYRPKYLSTNWMLLILSDLGLTRADSRIARGCELWIRRFASRDGGFGIDGGARGHLCVVGNTARALIRFGYAGHPKVRSALEWLLANQAKLGGWSCWGSGRNLDSWEGMSAFAALPRSLWNSEIKEGVARGAEYYLGRELHRQGEAYPPWFRFHYPVHYYYDLLVGLDILTALGYGQDRRLRFALQHLRRRRRRDGRWILDAVHPDVEGGMAEWLENHPSLRPTPFALEAAGRPSKMITFLALRVLKRVGE